MGVASKYKNKKNVIVSKSHMAFEGLKMTRKPYLFINEPTKVWVSGLKGLYYDYYIKNFNMPLNWVKFSLVGQTE